MVNHSPSWYLDVLRDLGKRNDNSKFHQISIADSQSLQCSKCTNVSASMILNLPVQAIRIGVNSCSSFSQPAGDLSKSLCMCQLSATLLRLMAFNPSAGDASEFLAAFLRTPGCSDEKSMYYIYIIYYIPRHPWQLGFRCSMSPGPKEHRWTRPDCMAAVL